MVEALIMLGKHYTRTKNYPRAIHAYEKVVHLQPDSSDAFFNLGYIHATTGKFDAAEKAFTRVVQSKPPYLYKAIFNLAVVQQKLGKKQESITNLEEAVAVGPENEKALAYLRQLKISNTNRLAEQSR